MYNVLQQALDVAASVESTVQEISESAADPVEPSESTENQTEEDHTPTDRPEGDTSRQ